MFVHRVFKRVSLSLPCTTKKEVLLLSNWIVKQRVPTLKTNLVQTCDQLNKCDLTHRGNQNIPPEKRLTLERQPLFRRQKTEANYRHHLCNMQHESYLPSSETPLHSTIVDNSIVDRFVFFAHHDSIAPRSQVILQQPAMKLEQKRARTDDLRSMMSLSLISTPCKDRPFWKSASG